LKEYDVVVVGAGVAGSLASKLAAEKGLKTLLLERGEVPGEKLALNTGFAPKVWDNFPYIKNLFLDVAKEIPTLPRRGYCLNFVTRDNIITVSHTIRLPKGEYSALVTNFRRRVLYKALADKSIEAGAEFRGSTLVKDVVWKDNHVAGVITETGEKIPSKMVIAADGTRSTIARRAGLIEKWRDDETQFNFVQCFEMSDKDIEERFEGLGYYFIGPTIAPGDGSKARVWLAFCPGGVVVSFATYLNYVDKDPRWYLNNGLYKLKIVNYLMKPAKGFPNRPIEFAKTLPTHNWLRKMYTHGLMVAGDAAGTCDPLSMEGFRGAAISGYLAAETAVEAVEKGDYTESSLAEYQRKWERTEFAKTNFPMGRQVAKLMPPMDKFIENVQKLSSEFASAALRGRTLV
jgi:electron transfer flavoprotein-quinone oxidoreductase